nr:S46 family peptidase [Rhizomicrobium palustre]
MWTFDNFPADAVKAKYGVSITQKWLDDVRAAAVRLSGGCSASVVTGSGLVLTNHHCVRDCAQDLSTASTNYITDGFMAAKREDEKLCPGMQAEILDGISDVTARVNAASEGKTGADYLKARDAAIAAIEKEGCTGKEDKFRCQVITLYQGGQYKLYTYRKYADVRLVFAPEEPMAFFGGDPDNFNFPRYDLDFSMVRLYENGKPVVTPKHLKWTDAEPKVGQPVFVAGNPGSTSRLNTLEQLQGERDIDLPDILLMLSEFRGRLIRFSEESPEKARTAQTTLFGIENSYKALKGRFEALLDPKMMATKKAADDDLKAKVKADPKLAAAIGDPWNDIAKIEQERVNLQGDYNWLEARAGFRSSLFRYARVLVRAAEERGKPNGDRLREYGDSRLPLLKKNLLDAKPVYPDLEQLCLEFWLSKLRENLTADAAGTKLFLGKRSPEALAAELAKSKLGDPAFRKQLWEGGLAAIKASDDPMIKFVLATDAASRSARKAFEDKIAGPEDRATEAVAKARFAVYGTKTYPDATFSLRLSYGAVEGWNEKGKFVEPFTYYGGLYERATGEEPFKLPPRWVEAKGKLNEKTVFDFATTNDIIGGNSGSPLISAKGEVLGAVFDGNIESLGGDFWYDGRVNRTVVASSAAITEALKKIYHQDGLVKELMAK